MAGLRTWLRSFVADYRTREPGMSISTVAEPRERTPSPADAHNDFALALYGRLRIRPGNVFFSPFSIRTALAMAHAGAAGETASQMATVIRMSDSDDRVYRSILERTNPHPGRLYALSAANSLWIQEHLPFKPEYLELIATHFGGEATLVDFLNKADIARVTINQWVEERTERRIVDLIPSSAVTADTRLVLVNAVYFKGTWRLPFDETFTDDEPFHLEEGGTVPVPLMRQESYVRYLERGDYQAVELDYKGCDLSMLIILPNRKTGLSDLEKRLSADMIDDCASQMSSCVVEIVLPRFKLTWGTVDLTKDLIELGMRLPFDPVQADFSGINGHLPPDQHAVFISLVLHKAFVEVNEQGTEAAAATAIIALTGRMSRPPAVPVFRADHPFVFAIRDRKTGALVFLGRVSDPTRT